MFSRGTKRPAEGPEEDEWRRRRVQLGDEVLQEAAGEEQKDDVSLVLKEAAGSEQKDDGTLVLKEAAGSEQKDDGTLALKEAAGEGLTDEVVLDMPEWDTPEKKSGMGAGEDPANLEPRTANQTPNFKPKLEVRAATPKLPASTHVLDQDAATRLYQDVSKDVDAGRCCLATIATAHNTLNLHPHAATKFDVFTRTSLFLETIKDEKVMAEMAGLADANEAHRFFGPDLNLKLKDVSVVKAFLQQKKNDNPGSKHFVNVGLIREMYKDVPMLVLQRRVDDLDKGLRDVKSFVGMPSP
jgi:hypothetical protein